MPILGVIASSLAPPTPDIYTQVATSLEAVQYFGGAVIGTKYYIVGGSNTTHLQEYDSGVDTWTAKSSLPANRDALSAGVVGTKLYAVGGYLNQTFNTEWDQATNTWTAKTAMTTGRSYLKAVGVGNIVYAIGGYNGTAINPTPNEAYDTTTDTWSTKATHGTGRTGFSPGTDGTNIWMCGGENAGGRTSELTRYNVSANTYTNLAAMPAALTAGNGAYVNGYFYFISGVSATPPYYVQTAYKYNAATDTWTTITSPPTIATSGTSGVIGSKIYYVVGDAGGSVPRTCYYYQT